MKMMMKIQNDDLCKVRNLYITDVHDYGIAQMLREGKGEEWLFSISSLQGAYGSFLEPPNMVLHHCPMWIIVFLLLEERTFLKDLYATKNILTTSAFLLTMI